MDQFSSKFSLELFDRTVQKCQDVKTLQSLCVELYSQMQGHRMMYEQLIKDNLPKIPEM
jgi:hypothetical protein|tara:strand:- start:288 stop:464 length:177 start_codon:yes stop_codon:yes gene_type:complete